MALPPQGETLYLGSSLGIFHYDLDSGGDLSHKKNKPLRIRGVLFDSLVKIRGKAIMWLWESLRLW